MQCPRVKIQHPLEKMEHPQPRGRDGLHGSVLVAPQYPPKDPSVNQACGYVQSTIQGGARSPMHHEDRR